MQVNYRIYMLPLKNDLCFRDLNFMSKLGYAPKKKDYELVYSGTLNTLYEDRTEVLQEIHRVLNMERPADYRRRSLSVSDVVELDEGEHSSFYFCDAVGWELIRNFSEVDS